ncbi:unnamed protein product [Closterium sp. Yama58-4]|nr:unnamed protein product [Closterium sp. Yama58-4]
MHATSEGPHQPAHAGAVRFGAECTQVRSPFLTPSPPFLDCHLQLRRDRISQRMRALYDLVPNARNTDTASMLDEAIQYVRSLQEQVQTLKKEKGESQGTSSVGTGSLGRPADSSNEGGEGGTSRSAGQQSMGQSMAQSVGQSMGQAGYGGTEDGFGSENEVWEGSAAPSPMGSGMGSRRNSLQLLADRQGSGEFGALGREVGDGRVEAGLRGVGVGVEGYMKSEPETDAPSGSDVGVTGAAAGLSPLVATAAGAATHGSASAGATGVLAAGGLVDGAKGGNNGVLVTEAAGVTGLESMIVGGAEVEWPGEIELTLEDMNMVDLGGSVGFCQMAVSATAFQRKFLLERVTVDRPGSSPCLSSSTSATPFRRALPVAEAPAASANSAPSAGPSLAASSAHTASVSASPPRTTLHSGLASSSQHHVNGSAVGASARFSASSVSPASACATELADDLFTAATTRAAAAEALALARAALAVAKEAAELSLSEEAMGLYDDDDDGDEYGLPQESSLSSPLLGWGEVEEEGADEIMSSDQLHHMWLLAVDKPIPVRRAARRAGGASGEGKAEEGSSAQAVGGGDVSGEDAHPAEFVMWAEDAPYHGLERALEDGAREAERKAEREGEAERKPKRVVVRSQKKGKRLAEREKALQQRQAASAAAAAATAAAPARKKPAAEGPALALGEEESEAEDAVVAEGYRRAANESVFAMFDTAGGNPRLLSVQEEIDLSKGVQALLKLERAREELEEKLLRAPTRAEWAEAAGLSVAEVQARVAWGKECKQRMIASNMRLVISVAKKYTTRGLSLEELITEGCMGLMKGVEKFDHSKGFKFSTYAHWWIRQAISRSVAEQSRIVRLPAHIYELVSRINRAKAMLTDALGRAPAEREVAQLVGITRGKLRSIMRTVRAPTSMDRPIASDDGDETLGAFVADTTLENPEDMIMQQLMRKDLENALHTLTPREREVMWHRYGLDDGRVKTLEELGSLFRVTRERVRQIEGKALLKLRQPGRSSALKSYIDGHALPQHKYAMALTVFSTNPTLNSLLRLSHIPDEFSALFDAPTSNFVRDSNAMACTTVDVKETSEAFEFIADLPGLKKDEVKVQIEDKNLLTISGERSREVTEKTEKYHRVERSTGKFLRRFRLPDNVEVDKIAAISENGVLTVTVPKVKPPEPKKPAVVDVPIN